MTKEEAIFWFEVIVNDTLDPHDETDANRNLAVRSALKVLNDLNRANEDEG